MAASVPRRAAFTSLVTGGKDTGCRIVTAAGNTPAAGSQFNILKVAMFLNIARPYPGWVSEAVAVQIGGRLLDLVFLSLCIASLIRGRSVIVPARRGGWVIALGTAVSLYSFFSLLYGMLVGGSAAEVRDFYEPFRPFLLLIALLAFHNDTAFADEKLWDHLWVGSLIAFAAVVFVNVTSAPVLSQVVTAFYGAAKDKFSIEGLVSRQTGFFSNPNWAGLYLSWVLAYLLFNRRLLKPSSLALMLLTLLLILATGSRTGLICTVFTIGVWMMIRMTLRQLIIVYLGLLIVPLLAFNVEALVFLPKHLRELVTAVVHGGSLMEVATFRIRVEIWAQAINDYFYGSPLIGRGPFKGDVLDVIDNQYVKWLIWYGLVGLALMLFFYGYIVRVAYNCLHHAASMQVRRFAGTFFLMSCSLLLAGMTGAFFDVTQLVFLYIAMFGALLRMASSSVPIGSGSRRDMTNTTPKLPVDEVAVPPPQ